MAHFVKRIARASSAKLASYAGPSGELTMDTTTNDLVLQTGQAGGVRLAKASTAIAANNGLSVTAGGTLATTTTVSGVDATTAAKGVVQLSNATTGTSQTKAATEKAVSDALQAAKNYADTAVAGAAPNVANATGVLPIAHGGTGSSTKNFVDLTTNQTVAGNKTFTSNPYVKNASPTIVLQQTDITKGTNPSASQTSAIAIVDSAGTGTANRTGYLQNVVDANGLTSTLLYAYQFANGATNTAALGVYCSADGNTKYAVAPTPVAGDNSTKIATTAWVGQNAANKDVSNLTATGKKTLVHASMPSEKFITMTIPASGSTVTAPDDGYVHFWANSSSASAFIYLEANNVASRGYASNLQQALNVYIPVKKGSAVEVSYVNITTPRALRFIYANGNAPTN